MKQISQVDVKKYEIQEVPEPHAGKGEVRIKVAYNGICGSDLHFYLGQHPSFEGEMPLVYGHEFSGTVDEIGEGVEGFEIGMPAAVQPVRGCGHCKWCTDPKSNVALCPEERFYNGGSCEYFVAEAANVVTFRKNTNLREIALTEPLSVTVHGIRLVPEGVKDKIVLVTGAGPIGLFTAQALKAFGAKAVFVTDLQENRRKTAAALGLIPVDPLTEDIVSVLREKCGVSQFELSFECAGSEKSLDNCVALTEPKGAIVLLAVFARKPVVDIFRIEDREIRIYGSFQYTPEDFRIAADLLEEKKINCEILSQKEFGIAHLPEALEWTLTHPSECIKTMLKIDYSL